MAILKLGRATGTALALVLLLAPRATLAESPGEYQVKGAFLYNFAKFVDWPAEVLAGRERFRICVLASPRVERQLREVVEGKSAGALAVEVYAASAASEGPACQILFVASSRGVSAEEVAREVSGASVLTVGETERFALDGGMVNFVSESKKLRFEINKASVEAAGLGISSHLLKLAHSVYE